MTVTKTLKEWQKDIEDREIEQLQGEESPICKKCGTEVGEERIELAEVKGKEKRIIYYHPGCFMCLPRVRSFQITFIRPESADKNSKIDVLLDGEILLPGNEAKKRIVELCYLLETEYQHQRRYK